MTSQVYRASGELRKDCLCLGSGCEIPKTVGGCLSQIVNSIHDLAPNDWETKFEARSSLHSYFDSFLREWSWEWQSTMFWRDT